MKKILYTLLIVTLSAGIFMSCSKDSLEPTLAQDKVVEGSIQTVDDVFGVLNGTYNRVTSTNYYGRDLIIYGEVRSDNCFANANSGRFLTPAAMDMGDNDGYATNTWTSIYQVIASANIVIGLDPDALEGDADQIAHYQGEAYALRALAHFDLLKLYGQQHVGGGTMGIPYILEYKGEDLTPERNSVDEVRGFIYADINQALALMDESLNHPSKEFLTTFGVYALQARVATYFGDWSTVIDACEAIIGGGGGYAVVPEGDFVASWYTDGAVNSIWELAYSTVDNNNINGLSQIYRGDAYGDIAALDDILTIFDAADVRVSPPMISVEASNGYLRNMGKYPSADYSDNISIFRYEEVLLNYAEALFNTTTGDPLAILNEITAERGADALTTVDEDIILRERRRELCFEGFRFDDLARTGRDIPEVDPFNQTHGGPTYGSYNYAYPIPEVEMNANSAMVQNDGYN